MILFNICQKIIGNVDVVVGQFEIPMEVNEAVFSYAFENGITTVLNPAPADKPSDSLLENTSWFIPNEVEFEEIFGKTFNEHNEDLKIDLGHDAELYLTVKRQIPQTWTDVNGHMNETNYLEVCSQATDKFMEMMGMDVDYIKTKQESYFTVETHIRHLNEAKEGMLIMAKTQVLEASGKKLRLFHTLETDNGTLIATGEHMLLHVSLKTRASCLPSKKIAKNLDNF